MSTFRIALANTQFPAMPEESITSAEQTIAQTSTERADLICFAECFIPGYRGMGKRGPPLDRVFLERAWSVIRAAAAKANLAVVLGTERVVDDALLILPWSASETVRLPVTRTRCSSTPPRRGPIRPVLGGAFSRPAR